jgi:ClpP class serine protease
MLTEGILLLNQKFATDYFSRVESFTNPANAGKIDDFFKQHYESKIAATKDIYSFDGVNAHIRINGPMSPNGPDLFDIFYGYGGVSFGDIIDASARAAEEVDPANGKVFFEMNTPGSTVDGVDNTFQEISSLSATHSTEAVNHGMVASGGIWVASAMRTIRAANPVAFTGSVGVIVAGYDISEMLENMGVKKVVITNHEASEKHPDISTTEGQNVIRKELQAIYEVFKGRVLSGRPGMTEEVIDNLKGSVKVASEALNIGLIDSISGVDVVKPPAAAGKTNKEASIMNLKELLAANPDAQAEYDAAITAAADTARAEGETAGTEKGREEMQAKITAVAPFLASADYPAVIGETALKVLKGEEAEVTLKASIAAVDAVKESTAQTTAAGETTATGETVGDNSQTTALSEDGMVNNPEQLKAAAAQHKTEYGGDQ